MNDYDFLLDKYHRVKFWQDSYGFNFEVTEVPNKQVVFTGWRKGTYELAMKCVRETLKSVLCL